MERRDDADGLVAHARQDGLVGRAPAADQRDAGLESRLVVLLHELNRQTAREERPHRIDVTANLRDVRAEVRRVQRHPQLLDDLAPGVLERLLKAAEALPAEGIVCGDRRDLLVLELRRHPLAEGMVRLARRKPGPHHPLRGLPLSHVVASHDRVRGRDFLGVYVGLDRISR